MAAVGRSGSTAEPSAAAAAAAAGGTAELGSTVCMRQDKREARQSAVARSAVESCAAAGMGNTVARVAWAANTIRLVAVPVADAVFADCAAIAAVAIATVAIAEAVGYAAIAVAAMVASAAGPPVAARVASVAGLTAAAVPSVVAAPAAVPVAVRLAAVAALVAEVSVAAALSAVELTAQLAALVPPAVVVIGCSIVWLAASSCPPAPSTSFSHVRSAKPRCRMIHNPKMIPVQSHSETESRSVTACRFT
ncbi:hypothetical protein BREU_1282 [Bifidobacterium reuteri DSM 23975]|uniref:Uncharacterized protein n=1 Tax=Bifidobacterium reuteri DSM 23975 TaxID=1437610 RepID=A0A087CMK6_9BIFI|nr:hypothetical protein BREU_1282 [Bifidobacterium reuteri DSM 23975]